MEGRELRIALIERGLAIKQFAAMVEKHVSVVSRWLNGHIPIPAWVPIALNGIPKTMERK